LAEEVMTNNMQGGVTEDLNQFDGMHFLADFVTARESYDDTGTKGFFDRFGKERKATLEAGPGGTWDEYMVGEKLPCRAWKWESDQLGMGFLRAARRPESPCVLVRLSKSRCRACSSQLSGERR